MATDFCTALYPSHIFEKLVGLNTFTVHGQPGSRKLTKIPTFSLHKTVIYLLVLFSIISTIYLNDIVSPTKTEQVFYWYVAIYDTHADFILVFILFISLTRNKTLLLEIWTKIMEIDTKLCVSQKLDGVNRKVYWFCTLWTFAFCTMNIFVHAMDKNLVSDQKIFYFNYANCVYCITDFYKIYLDTTVLGWLISLGFRYKFLTEKLQDEVTVTAYSIRKTKEIHAEICQVTRNINDIYSSALLLTFSMEFFVITFKLFKLIRAVSQNTSTFEQIILPATWMFCFASNSFAISYAAEFLTKQANSIKEELLKQAVLKGDVLEIRKEISAFGLQLLHNKVAITAGHFFTIDLSLVYVMIGAATTYLVILVQFDITKYKF